MSTVNLHLPDSLHSAAQALAKKDDISLDQLILLALAEKVSALMSADILGKRAARASREKFDQALDKVADVEPDAFDRL